MGIEGARPPEVGTLRRAGLFGNCPQGFRVWRRRAIAAGPASASGLVAGVVLFPALLLLGSWVSSALAASYDPALEWETLTTDHFQVHFHDEERQIALDFAEDLEAAWTILTTEIGTTPRGRIQVTLIDWTDSPNGYATIVPYNTIVIYVVAPDAGSTLELYEDWWEAIGTHELTHVLHLSTVRGLPRLARLLLGSIISTNMIAPGWITEGYATFEETRHTSGGRGRSAIADMIKRTAVIEGEFPALGSLDGFQATPPGGNLRYLFGQDFIQFIADRTGANKWSEWVQNYGASVPFFLRARETFGATFRQLHREWQTATEARYNAQVAAVEAEGRTTYTVLSPPGESCGGPAWRPDSKALVFGCSNLRTGSRLLLHEESDAAVSPADDTRTGDSQTSGTPKDGTPEDGTGAQPGAATDPERKVGRKAKKKGKIVRVGDRELKVLLDGQAPRSLTWRSDGKALAFASLRTDELYHAFSDIYLYNTEDKDLDLLTDGARARDPVFSPDGTRLLMVTNELATNQLATMTVDQRLTTLTQYDDHTQLSAPRFSPDGRQMAVSVWQDGQRDLWLFTPEGQPARRLTWDTAIDREPEWSPDGAWLYFTSDRSGIPNIYALRLADDRLFQVTNVTTGAYAASARADGKVLAFNVFSTPGSQVVVMPVTPERWKDRGFVPRWPVAAPVGRSAAAGVAGGVDGVTEVPLSNSPESAAAVGPSVSEDGGGDGGAPAAEGAQPEAALPEGWSFGPYRAMPTLVPPRYWLPYSALSYSGDNIGLYAVAATSGTDALHYYGYSGYLTWRSDARAFGGGGSFTFNRHRPVVSLSASSQITPYGEIYRQSPVTTGPNLPGIESTGLRYFDRRIRGGATVSYPLSSSRGVFGYYSGTWRTSLDELPADAYVPFLPTRGFFSSIGAGWSYGRSKSYALSISPEEARSLGFGVEFTPFFLGSFTYDDNNQLVPFTQLQASGEWREYRTNPWIPNQVLAWRLAGGGTLGDSFAYGSYRLGGSWTEGGIAVVPDEWRALRGFYPASDSGEWFWLGSAEYRLPIWNIDKGFGTVPLFLRTLSGALVADAGNAFDDAEGAVIPASRVGVGAELSLYMIVGYGGGLLARAGYAFGAYGEDAISLGSLDGIYFTLGSSF